MSIIDVSQFYIKTAYVLARWKQNLKEKTYQETKRVSVYFLPNKWKTFRRFQDQ